MPVDFEKNKGDDHKVSELHLLCSMRPFLFVLFIFNLAPQTVRARVYIINIYK